MADIDQQQVQSLVLSAELNSENENLEQLGPIIKSIYDNGRQEAFLEQLTVFVRKKEGEIERMCNSNYQEFVHSVDQLLKVRQGTVNLKNKIIDLNYDVQLSGKKLATKKKELIQTRRIQKNIDEAVETLQTCLYVLDLANRVNNLIEVDIDITQPIELEEVILGALEMDSFDVSMIGASINYYPTNDFFLITNIRSLAPTFTIVIKDPVAISDYFRSSPPIIIRHAQTYRVPNPPSQTFVTATFSSSLDFKVLMCNPVLQGIISDQTNLIITDLSSETFTINEEDQLDDTLIDFDNDEDILEQEVVPLELDSFSLLSSQMESPTNGLYFRMPDELNERESDSTASVSLPSSEEEGVENGDSTHLNLKKSEFKPLILSSPLLRFSLQPTPKENDDPESWILISMSMLARLGCQSGSWVLVSSTKNKPRLCQIYAADIPNSINHSLPSAYITPQLHFNLGLNKKSVDTLESISIQSIDKSHSSPPVAKSLTVARVASPCSHDKTLYLASLDELKRWFEDVERIVCEGDVISVPIDEENARLRPQKTEGDIESLEDIKIPMAPTKHTAVVHFIITRLEPNDRKQILKKGYGKRIDPKLTKMVQTGLEHSRVPPVIKRYLRIFSETPIAPPIGSALTAPETPYAKLYDLVSSCLDPSASLLNLSCTVLLHGQRGCGKKTTVEWVSDRLGIHLYEVNCFDFAGETDAKIETSIRARLHNAITYSPCVFLLRHVEALARKSAVLETGQEPTVSVTLQDCFKQLVGSFKRIGHPVLVIGTTSDIEKIPASVIGCFRHQISFEAPAEPARLAILEQLTIDTPLAPDVSLSSLATQTAALVAKDLTDLIARAGIAALERVEKGVKKSDKQVQDVDLLRAGIALTAADFETALGKARASYSDSIGAPKIPNVTWDDVGGLASVKDDILDTIQLPLEHPELFASGMKKRSGILLYGPPGTGKTLLAKAVATSCSLNFFSVKGPELLNMYIGESEANVRRVFQRARDAKPCVIFFDELDSVAPKRGEKGDSGGVMDRIVSQLLAELDGLGQGSGAADVFVIGATNRPDLLDPALLRPGRFEKLLYLGVSEDHESQLNIIRALTRKFRLASSLDLAVVANKCPFNYTGADFYALCSDAMLKAMARTAEAVETKIAVLNANPPHDRKWTGPLTSQYYLDHLATPQDIYVEVTQQDFERALKELVPSVSEKELEHYRLVQKRFTQQDGKDKQNNDQENTSAPNHQIQQQTAAFDIDWNNDNNSSGGNGVINEGFGNASSSAQILPSILPRLQSYRRLPAFFSTTSFETDIEDGLTSETFDLSQNLHDGDSRAGLEDSDEIKKIMKQEGIGFDQARLIRQQQKFKTNNIDPQTGVPKDPKFVSFS
ncbi:12000_t:CDS:10 [Ambispora gerdemannii]|uniref:Peroxisomal ATPase PEX6 n=1 Tax=Ambispora gerdemannii TaxID=144530 RepID=A0A9N8Z379_9GLOM|nr:12000_t:CDS:10 [Ambispora gerdemannii]